MKDIRKKLLVCKPCAQEHRADRSTAQQLMPVMFSVMHNSVSCDQVGQPHCEFGVYGSHINIASGETAIVSGKQKGSRTEHGDVVGWWSGSAVASLC